MPKVLLDAAGGGGICSVCVFCIGEPAHAPDTERAASECGVFSCVCVCVLCADLCAVDDAESSAETFAPVFGGVCEASADESDETDSETC